LDRAVVGALKAEDRAINRSEISQRENKSKTMTRADITAQLLMAWEVEGGVGGRVPPGLGVLPPRHRGAGEELAAALDE
jgi:hypothetical protein